MMPMLIDEGRGPAVLLLHGAPSTAAYFAPLVARLAPAHRVLVPELPGYGRSPRDPGRGPIEDGHEQLIAWLAAHQLTELSLLGFSFGAFRALQLALDPRLTVRSLVSLSGMPSFTEDEKPQALGLAGALRAGFDLTEAMGPRMLSPAFLKAHPEAETEVRAWLAATTATSLADEFEELARSADLLPRLTTLRAPLLARVGELDRATPPERSRALVAAVPRGQLEIVPGAGHSLLHEDTEATCEAVARWFAATVS
jgi:3-oxoadipate enol-lactonase